MRKRILPILLIFLFFTVKLTAQTAKTQDSSKVKQEKEILVLITTSFGDIKVKLYNDTPLHRDNFVKLVNQGYFNGSTFHRVIKSFMIQGGSTPGSNGAQDVGYTIPAEILKNHFHKKGALCAARTDNPKKESSGSQFYIVQGKVFNDLELNTIGQQSGHVFTKEERNTYKTIGGSPHLDANYTVFGEVVEGLDIIDKIAAVKTLPGDRPVEDLKMTMKIVE
jgi:cyclophilin family peptidyl-prolyl cis-trans isomerase